MAEPFEINLTDGAQGDLRWFATYAQRIIVEGIGVHLRYQPTAGSRRIISMQPNPVAGWELRLGDYRVLYDVDDATRTVTVDSSGRSAGTG